MTTQQINFNQRIIKHNEAEIVRIQKELENPRIRNIQQRISTIEDLKVQIQQAREVLAG